jgi:hypothetical protein
MENAKGRHETDPFLSMRPILRKGIVISSPITISQDGSLSLMGGMDPLELRRGVLFWDRIKKPQNNIFYYEPSEDEKFLASCGIFEELELRVNSVSGLIGFIYAHLHMSAFYELEKREPGLWAMSEGENSFNLKGGGVFSDARGALVELHRAIPLPTQDVPLAELLNFKEKRRDEIVLLTMELDGLFSRVIKAEDSQFELGRAVREIDQRCRDIVAVGKEANISFSLSDFNYGISLEFNSANLLSGGALGAIMGSSFGLPMVGAAIGAGVSTIKFSVGLGGRLERSKKSAELALSPYRVVSRLVNEPI